MSIFFVVSDGSRKGGSRRKLPTLRTLLSYGSSASAVDTKPPAISASISEKTLTGSEVASDTGVVSTGSQTVKRGTTPRTRTKVTGQSVVFLSADLQMSLFPEDTLSVGREPTG